MKKTLTIIAVLFCSSFSFGQAPNLKDAKVVDFKQKADTIVVIQIKLDDFRRLLFAIDKNIDSKAASAEILNFLQQSARIAEAPKPELPKSEKPKQ